MTSRNKNIPALRFKNFRDNWNKKELGDICTFYSGGTPASTNKNFYSGNIPFIGSGNIYDSSVSSFITEEALNSSSAKMVEAGDLLYALYGANSGEVAISKITGAINQAILCIRSNQEHIQFLYALLLFNKDKIVSKYLQGGQGNLSANIIKGLKYHFPSLPEQQKIASFLSAIDEKIRQLTKKKELLEQYKKGVMQQLFSGKLRFKPAPGEGGGDYKGKAYPKWEEKLYEDIFSFYSTNSLSREKLNYEVGTVKNIHYGDIHTRFSTLFDITKEMVPFINEDVDLSKLKPENYCQEGDLVIADASEDYADIGKSIELFNLNKQKIVAGLHTFLARPAKGKMYKGFSGYLVQAPYVRKQIMTIAQGTKVLSLSPGRLGKVKLLIPSTAEQQKIASFLSSLDTKIESVSAQIEGTRLFKKGLLQQMFV